MSNLNNYENYESENFEVENAIKYNFSQIQHSAIIELSDNAYKVYSFYVSVSFNKSKSYYSIKKIACILQKSYRSITRANNELVEKKYIIKKHTNSSNTVILINKESENILDYIKNKTNSSENLIVQKDNLIGQKDNLIGQKDNLIGQKDNLIGQNDNLNNNNLNNNNLNNNNLNNTTSMNNNGLEEVFDNLINEMYLDKNNYDIKNLKEYVIQCAKNVESLKNKKSYLAFMIKKYINRFKITKMREVFKDDCDKLKNSDITISEARELFKKSLNKDLIANFNL